MAIADKAFHVVTEFKFEMGSALAQSDMLHGKLGRLTQAVETLEAQLMALPQLLLRSFGGYLTIGSLISGAINSQQKLQKASLGLANIISANMHAMTGDVGTFNERMMTSKQIIQDVAKTAQKFNLNESDLVYTFETIAATLAPKGLAGENFNVAADMARGLLKSSPLLGVDPGLVQNQLREIVEGRAGANNTLFVRLATETQAFKGVLGKGGKSGGMAKTFNALPAAERVERLRTALLTFASDMDVVKNSTQLLSAMMTGIKNQIWGINSVLRPLGEVIMPVIVKAFSLLSMVIEKYVRPVALKFSQILQSMVENPERVYATIQQLKNFQSDLMMTGNVLAVMELPTFIQGLMKLKWAFTGVAAVLALPAFAVAATRVRGVIATVTALMTKYVMPLLTFANGLKVIGFLFKSILLPMVGIQLVLTTLSRASAYANVELKKMWLGLVQTIVDGPGKRVVTEIARAVSVFDSILDGFARSLTSVAGNILERMAIFATSTVGISVLEGLATAIQFVTMQTINLISGLAGLGNMFLVMLGSLATNFVALFALSDRVAVKIFSVLQALFTQGIPGLLDGISIMVDNLRTVVVRGFMGMIEAVMLMFQGKFAEARDRLAGGFSTEGVILDPAVIFDKALGSLKQVLGAGGPLLMPEFDNTFASMGDALIQGTEDMRRSLEGIYFRSDDQKNKVINRQINQNVNINQSFREQQEPDRIAKSLVNTLSELASNPQQSRGNRSSMRSPFIAAASGI